MRIKSLSLQICPNTIDSERGYGKAIIPSRFYDFHLNLQAVPSHYNSYICIFLLLASAATGKTIRREINFYKLFSFSPIGLSVCLFVVVHVDVVAIAVWLALGWLYRK